MNECDELKNKIIEYANNDTEFGWFHINYEGLNYKFPKRALIWYTFGKMIAIKERLPEYTPFSYSGFKLPMDNCYHTDCMLGSYENENDLYDYRSNLMKACRKASWLIEEEYEDIFNFDFTILANSWKGPNFFKFMVYDHIPLDFVGSSNIHILSALEKDNQRTKRAIVIPHAGIEYDIVARKADIIITETGGKLCHLAVVARETDKLLIRVENAIKTMSKFDMFWMDLNSYTLGPAKY